jgi:hypothetical protein
MQSGGLALRQCEISYSIVRGFRGGRKYTASGLNKAACFARAMAKFCKFQAAARVKFQTPIKLQNRELPNLLNLARTYCYKTPFVLGTPARSLILIARRNATANALNADSAT